MSGGYVDPYGFSKGGKSSSGGSGGHSGYVDPYGFGKEPKAAKPAHHGGGGIGGFFHSVGEKLGMAGHDIKQIPGGTVHMVEAALPSREELRHPLRFNTKSAKAQWGEFASHPVRSYQDTSRGKFGKEAQHAAQQSGGLIVGSKNAIRHPLHDPFQTAVTVLPLFDVAGRAGEAAIGRTGTRTLKIGDKHVNLIPSNHAGARVLSRGYDRAMQRALTKEEHGQQLGRVGRRVAKHATKRFEGALKEEHRLAQRMRAVPAERLDKASGKLAKVPRARRLQQAALELTSTQTMPGEAARYHMDKALEAQKAGDAALARRHAHVGRIYERVGQRNLVHLDESRPKGEQVFINPAHKALAEADKHLARVGEVGDVHLEGKGVMTPEQLQAARNNPGRVRTGETMFEKPTPGKAGIPSTKLEFRRAEASRLQAASDRAQERVQRMRFTAADKKRIGNMSTPVDAATLREQLRPLDKQLRQLTEEWNAPAKQGGQMTEAEAEARFAELDKKYQSMLTKLVPEVSPYTRETNIYGKTFNREQLRRNTMGGKGGKYGKMKSVKQEELELAEAKLHDMIAKHPEHPVVRQVAALMRERQQLGDILTQRGGADIMGEQPKPLPSTGGISPYEERAQLHRILRKGTAAEARVKEFAQAAGTDSTVHGLNDLKEQAATLTDRINELRGTPGPEIKALRRDVAEIRKQIRDAEAPRARVMRGERPHVITAGGDIVRPIGANHADRIGAALSVAKDKLQQAEAAAERRQRPTGLLGGETARRGRQHVSYQSSEKAPARSVVAGARGQVTGKASEPVTKQTFTGYNIEHARIPKHITANASRHFRQIIRFVNTDAVRRDIVKTGSKISRGTGREVLLALPDETQAAITVEARQLIGQERSTIDTPEELAQHADMAAAEEGLRAKYQMFAARMLDKSGVHAPGAGHAAPDGYVWVDKNLLRGLQQEARPMGGAGAAAGRVVDNANHSVTALTVYFKVGHTGTRVLTNATTNIIQGSARPDHVLKSYRLWEHLSAEDRARMLAASGQHGFAALPFEGGTEGRVARGVTAAARGGAKFWARHADAPFRFNSLAYELRKADYETVAEVQRALDGVESGGHGLPAHEWSKISAAVRRADREAISYDRLSPFEQRFLTRGIWFYPWVKGATLFTVRTLLEHPYKSAVLGNAGVAGREQQLRDLGEVPSYEQGLLALGGGKKNPLTTDLSTFVPFSTAADIVQAPAHPGSLAEQFNPVAGALGQFAYGLNQYGAPSSNPYRDAALALFAPTPEQQFAEAFAARHEDQSQRMFPHTPGGLGLRYLLGPATPRRVNRAALAKAAKRERSGQR